MATTKDSGITAVYTSLTGSIVTTSRVVNSVANAAQSLANQAEQSAQISLIESSKNLLAALGDGGLETIQSAKEVMEALRKM